MKKNLFFITASFFSGWQKEMKPVIQSLSADVHRQNVTNNSATTLNLIVMKNSTLLLLICMLLKFSTSFAQKNPDFKKEAIDANASGQAQKPNIIFILGDDIGYDLLKVNGGESYSTPNLDSMARHGMNFTHCEASPVCAPSRSMFLTGRYNFRNYSNWGYMSNTEKTIANIMHDSGYITGIFGKLQLQYKPATMRSWGWDRHIVFSLTEDTVTFRRYKDPVLVENGYRIPDSMTAGKYCDDILTQRIFDFIDSNKAQPFFVYYSMSIGHDPFCPTPDDSAFASWNANSGKSDTSFFASMVKYMDKKVGEILKKLQTSGLDRNTLVFFAGDNGTPQPIYYNAHGVTNIQGEKSLPKEGGTHVPLIAYWPGTIQEGSRCDNLIDFTDLLPTIAQAGKIKITGQYGMIDGTSFYSQLTGQLGKGKQQLYFYHDPHPGGYDSLRRWVRDKAYKLYDSSGDYNPGKFYNIKKDPEEKHPLNDSDLTQEQASLKALFKHILDTAGTWPACPKLTNSFVNNISSKSAIIGGTVVNEGASSLIDRGSNFLKAQAGEGGPFLDNARRHDSTGSLGTFSQKRGGLLPQTLYKFDMYAMNSNLSHSTGYVYSQFYTLSNAPLKQPDSFTAIRNNLGTTLTWTDAVFPKNGATKAGYILLYSTSKPALQQIENGKAPDGNEHILKLASMKLPSRPSKEVEIHSLFKDSTYYFLLIPYTWNGVNDSTYNYLTEHALSVTINQAVNVNNFNANESNANVTGMQLFPNPVKDVLHVKGLSSSLKTVSVIDASGKLFEQTTTANSSYSFNTKQLSPGMYFIRIDQGSESWTMKFIKD